MINNFKENVIATGSPYKIDKIALLIITILALVTGIFLAIFYSLILGICFVAVGLIFTPFIIIMLRASKYIITLNGEKFTFLACPFGKKVLDINEIANVYSDTLGTLTKIRVVVVVPHKGEPITIKNLDDANSACDSVKKILSKNNRSIDREIFINKQENNKDKQQ